MLSLTYFPYQTLGEVKIRSFVQEISSQDKSVNTFLYKNLPSEQVKTIKTGH
jgi:hypothetical protein